MIKLFPLGIATKSAFCNRELERKHLANNILATKHTLIHAPRRYGKTSLIQQVHEDLVKKKQVNTRWVFTDLLLVHDHVALQDTLLKAVGRLAGEILPLQQRALKTVNRFFASFKPEIIVSEKGVSVKLLNIGQLTQNTLVEAFEGLDKAAQSTKTQAVIVIDEFQQIASIKDNISLEGAIRHAAQKSKNLTFVFSGSNRHMLTKIFDDSSRPLYHLCDRIKLDRIASEKYIKFVQKAAVKQWGKSLKDDVIEEILRLTQCHPYYVNLLCSRLWNNEEKPFPNNVAAKYWSDYVAEEHGRFIQEIGNLSPNQRAVLKGIADEVKVKHIMQRSFLRKIRLAQSSVQQSTNVLIEKDLVYKTGEGVYKVLDPSLEFYLKND